MTTVIKQDKINGFHLSLEQDKFSTVYKVELCRMIDDSYCGYPIDERYYPTKEKALRRYRDVKKKIKNGDIT